MKITKNLCNRKIAKGKYFNCQVKKVSLPGFEPFFHEIPSYFI